MLKQPLPQRSPPATCCALQVDGDFGSIFGTLLPGTTAKLEPQEGRSFMEGARTGCLAACFNLLGRMPICAADGVHACCRRSLPRQWGALSTPLPSCTCTGSAPSRGLPCLQAWR